MRCFPLFLGSWLLGSLALRLSRRTCWQRNFTDGALSPPSPEGEGGRCRVSGPLPKLRSHAQRLGHRLADRSGALGDADAGAAQGRDLRLRATLAAADDRAGVAHATARWGGATGDERDDRLAHVLLHERGGGLLV